MPITSRLMRAGLCALALTAGAVTAGCSSDDSSTDSAGTGSEPLGASSTITGDSGSSSSTDEVDEVEKADQADEAVTGRPSEGCAAEPPDLPAPDDTGDVEMEMESGGQPRTYRLGVPDDGDGPSGVVFNLHGFGSDAFQQTIATEMPAEGTERGYLVVSPDAVDGAWEMTPEGADDDFLIDLLDHIAARHCIDLDRVHAAGFSLGSWKASVTACAHPDRFASLVLVGEEVAPQDCAKPVLAIHGTADAVVPYGSGADEGIEVTGGNAGLPGVEVNMPDWARQAGCSEEKDVERIEPDVERWVYRDCPSGFDVELYSVEGGGHAWPGSPLDIPALGRTTDTIDATTLALDWFDDHPLQR